MSAEHTLTEYHMGVALCRLNLLVSNRTLDVGSGDILNDLGRRVGTARKLHHGDWRVVIVDPSLEPTFNRMNVMELPIKSANKYPQF